MTKERKLSDAHKLIKELSVTLGIDENDIKSKLPSVNILSSEEEVDQYYSKVFSIYLNPHIRCIKQDKK